MFLSHEELECTMTEDISAMERTLAFSIPNMVSTASGSCPEAMVFAVKGASDGR